MKYIITTVVLLIMHCNVLAHVAGVGSVAVRDWSLADGRHLQGSLLALKDQTVLVEIDASTIEHINLNELCSDDKAYVVDRYKRIAAINNQHAATQAQAESATTHTLSSRIEHDQQILILVVCALLALMIAALYYTAAPFRRFIFTLGTVAIIASAYGFRERVLLQATQTSPAFLDSAFAPFKPNVRTSWNANYYLVESIGIPQHPMMAGITGWQQQVPLPQCYVGNNAWSIPMNPVPATNPIPVNADHFSRGAIAVATNGIAIFNPYTNTGVDALVDGQLDNWGGHCGRADDYHYHVAPLHLYATAAKVLPIAFGLDGYAVYGEYEPDGSAMKSLDANHGHTGDNGVYHYHGTQAKPYMIATMVGKVTEDTTHQIVPQAAAKPVRPSLTPLKGAVITDCSAKGNNGYVLSYTLNGQVYKVSYSWTASGSYTFDFINPDGTKTTSTYKGQAPCLSVSGAEDPSDLSTALQIVPNPAHATCTIRLPEYIAASSVRAVCLYNSAGQQVYSADYFSERINLSSLHQGLYLYCLSTAHGSFVKKLVIE